MNNKDTKETNVLAQASILMVAGIITRIIGVLYRSPLTSVIGDEGNGYYGIAVNIYTMILLVSSYSIPMAVSKVVSSKLAVHQYRNAHKVFKCALMYVLVVGGIASLITFFGASILIPSNQPKAIPVLRILAPTIFFSGFLGVFRGYFQAHGTMVPTSLSQIIEQVANAVISIGAALLFIHIFAGGDADKVPVFGAMGSAAGIGAGVITGLLFMLFIYSCNKKYFKKEIQKDDIFDISDEQMKNLMKLYTLDNKEIDLNNNYQGINSYGKILILKKNSEILNKVLIDKDMKLSDYYFYYNDETKKDNTNSCILLNSNEIKLPLYIRSFDNGDRIVVKNLNGSKKVSDIFIDNKVPKHKRSTYPILVDANNTILWVPNLKKSQFSKDFSEKYDIIIKCEAR